jgi:hypothetical protein
LPWQDESAQTVTMDELRLSGCDYFLTSPLSGCRVSITDKYITHIANQSSTTHAATQEGRDRAEEEVARVAGKPAHRRKLSESDASRPGRRFASESVAVADYDYIVDENNKVVEDVVVLGFRDKQGWTLKWLDVRSDRHPQGQWRAFAPIAPSVTPPPKQ